MSNFDIPPPKGEPVRLNWEKRSDQTDPHFLEYRQPEAQRESQHAVAFAAIGFITAIGWMLVVIFCFGRWGRDFGLGAAQSFLCVLIGAGVCGAIVAGIIGKMCRLPGLLAGYMIGVGLFAICPPLTFALMCGVGRL